MPKWTEANVPDQSGRVALITGANSGIGWDAARVLAGRGATVLLACRSAERGSEAVARIAALSPQANLQFLALTRIYVKPVLQLLREQDHGINAMVHITGVGFFENVPRILTDPGHAALIDLDSWTWPDIFAWLQQAGNIEQREMLTTFNCGIGFMLMVRANRLDATLSTLTALGETPIRIGEIVARDKTPGASQILVA
jgi:phosphoribosylaminoimidazole (AIR) synthetase